jgi:hypothetical protein
MLYFLIFYVVMMGFWMLWVWAISSHVFKYGMPGDTLKSNFWLFMLISVTVFVLTTVTLLGGLNG